MATLVSFHAHPDDESIQTGGTMALAAEAGHRVVLVVGTRGELGEPVDGVLDHGEELWERRVVETHISAEVLGAQRVEFLGYRDSGMMGEDTNDHPDAFWQADLDDAAGRLAAILTEELERGPVVLTIYDGHGGYGHPDHIQVHRVGRRAAELAGVERVYMATMNRTRILELMEAQATGDIEGEVPDDVAAQLEEQRQGMEEGPFGLPEEDLTHSVDVRPVLDRKRKSMEAHASQISDESFFLAMPPDAFERAFGTEWFAELGTTRDPGTPLATDLIDTLG